MDLKLELIAVPVTDPDGNGWALQGLPDYSKDPYQKYKV